MFPTNVLLRLNRELFDFIHRDNEMLQIKFEQDKKWIQQLRAARKFRPY